MCRDCCANLVVVGSSLTVGVSFGFKQAHSKQNRMHPYREKGWGYLYSPTFVTWFPKRSYVIGIFWTWGSFHSLECTIWTLLHGYVSSVTLKVTSGPSHVPSSPLLPGWYFDGIEGRCDVLPFPRQPPVTSGQSISNVYAAMSKKEK